MGSVLLDTRIQQSPVVDGAVNIPEGVMLPAVVDHSTSREDLTLNCMTPLVYTQSLGNDSWIGPSGSNISAVSSMAPAPSSPPVTRTNPLFNRIMFRRMET